MRHYFAPMEGLTDSVFRRLHHQFFPGLDRYYMPFLSPTIHRTLTQKEQRELPMADSVPFTAIPQILTKIPEDFLWAAQTCAERGYREVNLNAGCPSGTVVAKGKGAGLLADPDGLDRFLDAVFSASPLPISVKTRLGMTSAEEFPKLLDIFNRYPVRELIIHPRVRQQFYDGAVDMAAFRYALANSKNPVCYNGNLCTRSELVAFEQAFPQVEAVMIGRGLIGNPAMLGPAASAQMLEAFHDALLEEYLTLFGGSRNAMFRMKENWSYLICLFENGEKLGKLLRKTTDLAQYRLITARIFRELPLRDDPVPTW